MWTFKQSVKFLPNSLWLPFDLLKNKTQNPTTCHLVVIFNSSQSASPPAVSIHIFRTYGKRGDVLFLSGRSKSSLIWVQVLSVVPAAGRAAAEVGHARLQVAAGGDVIRVVILEVGVWPERKGESGVLGLSFLIGWYRRVCVSIDPCRAGDCICGNGGRVRPAVSLPQVASPAPLNRDLLPRDWLPCQGC